MTRRPRKGTSVRFYPADGIAPVHMSDPVRGLRFNIEARYGGTVEVDLVDVHPRQLAIAFAGALRRQSGIGGSLGARSTIKQHLQGYLKFFAYLREHSRAKTPADLRADDIEGYEAFLEAGGMKPIHRHTVLAKAILALRSIDADQPGLLDEGVRRRLAYTIARSVGRSRPRDAYSPFVARQLRDAARATSRRFSDGSASRSTKQMTPMFKVQLQTSKPGSRLRAGSAIPIPPSNAFISCVCAVGYLSRLWLRIYTRAFI